ncbi:MAG TPA: tRNA pseudouridine(38-40) synthase TruA [Gemmatimonadales bacterium]|nr:tRNA pseudouridine(38-40) synthase TruA [Gemmatimonadales bacterium]
MSRTFLARLHYDGGGFAGWQRQPARRTVQAEVERVLERLTGGRIVAHAAGRTDAGVHAAGMGVSFALPAKWTGPSTHRALNALLPADCWVEAVHEMRPGFHARKSATGRRYRYDVGLDAAAASPFRRRWEWALGRAGDRPLDVAAMRTAAADLLGEHDFRAFAVVGQEKAHWRCRLRLACWAERPEERGLSFHVAADRFLHHMVRMLVGTMVDIGLGRRPPDDVRRLLARTDNAGTSPPAPPQGLFFVAAEYPPDCFADPHEAPPHDALDDALPQPS